MKKEMKLIANFRGYDFYIGEKEDGKTIFNIIPEKEYPLKNPPFAGYFDASYICKVKRVPNLFKDHI